MKGVSPLISTVLLIAIILLMAGVVGPWMMGIATTTSNDSGTQVNNEIVCRQTAYDFDTDYQNSGVFWNFSGMNGTVSTKIVNRGTQNLYNFSIQLTLQTGTGTQRIVQSPDVNITAQTVKTRSNPLKPGEEWILEADVGNINDTWTLIEVKVLNDVCPRNSPSMEL